MYSACYRNIKDLPREFYHDPLLKDGQSWTIAMLAAFRGCIKDLPRRFYHDPTITDHNGYTVAMIIASNKCI